MRQAKEAARRGDIATAERYARLSAGITERLSVAQAYNLDRKQTILAILDDVKAAA
jgi:DNA polymerase III subunit delta'